MIITTAKKKARIISQNCCLSISMGWSLWAEPWYINGHVLTNEDSSLTRDLYKHVVKRLACDSDPSRGEKRDVVCSNLSPCVYRSENVIRTHNYDQKNRGDEPLTVLEVGENNKCRDFLFLAL